MDVLLLCVNVGDCFVLQQLCEYYGVFGGEIFGYILCLDCVIMGDGIVVVLVVFEVLFGVGQDLVEVCCGLVKLLQVMFNVCVVGDVCGVFEYSDVIVVVVWVQVQLEGCGWVFLCVLGIELLVCVMVEVVDVVEVQVLVQMLVDVVKFVFECL